MNGSDCATLPEIKEDVTVKECESEYYHWNSGKEIVHYQIYIPLRIILFPNR